MSDSEARWVPADLNVERFWLLKHFVAGDICYNEGIGAEKQLYFDRTSWNWNHITLGVWD